MKKIVVLVSFSLLFCFQTTISQIKKKPEKITVLWDTSLSMGNKKRELAKELSVLKHFLNSFDSLSVKLVEFSYKNKKTTFFNIKYNEVQSLFSYLETIFYDGATDFSEIFAEDNDFEPSSIFLFSDGNTILNKIQFNYSVPIYSITSINNSNHKDLKKISSLSGGKYFFTGFNSDFLSSENKKQTTKTITGFITDENNKKLKGVSVKVKGSYDEVFSNLKGEFKIEANSNDLLVFTFLNIKKEVNVNNKKELNILFNSNSNILDEVVISAKTKNTPESNEFIGVKNKDAIGYKYTSIDKKDINQQNRSLDQVMAGKPGIEIKTRGGGRYIYHFKKNRTSSILEYKPPVIDVNGTVYEQPNQPDLFVSDIQNITLLNSLAATNRYGGQGAFGVIVITTTSNYFEKEKKKNSLLVKNNDYKDDLKINSLKESHSLNLDEIINASNFNTSFSIYKNNVKKGIRFSLSDYIVLFDYFYKWNSKISLRILSNLIEIGDKNIKTLKTCAFKLDQTNNYILQKKIFEHLLNLDTENAQNYRDLALIYSSLGENKKALDLYQEMNDNQSQSLNFKGFKKALLSETKHFIKKNKKLAKKNSILNLHNSNFKNDIRIVFDWIDPNLEFEIQFVNPQKKFFKWKHTLLENKKRILKELDYGFAFEDFVLDNAKSGGEWIINLEVFDNDSLKDNFSYLKYTIYTNYGLKNETKIVKVIKLNDLKSKISLDRFYY